MINKNMLPMLGAFICAFASGVMYTGLLLALSTNDFSTAFWMFLGMIMLGVASVAYVMVYVKDG